MLSQLSKGDALPSAAAFSALSPFERFEFPRAYAIDAAELEQRYIDFSRRLHPDVHSGKSPKEQRKAIILTASLNEAFGILKSPFQRAELLLKLLGGADPSEDKRTPPGFLMEMIELREELEDARTAANTDSGQELLENLSPRREKTMAEIATLFDVESAAAIDIQGLRLRLNTLKYFDNMIDELCAWLDL